MKTSLKELPEAERKLVGRQLLHYEGSCPACGATAKFMTARTNMLKTMLRVGTRFLRRPRDIVDFIIKDATLCYECVNCGHVMGRCDNCDIFFSADVYADWVQCPECRSEYSNEYLPHLIWPSQVQ